MKAFGAIGAAVLLAGCASTPGMKRAELRATLTGQQELPAADPDATGTAVLRVVPRGPHICWEINVRGMAAATGAHIHQAQAGASGPPVFTFTNPGPDGRSEGCAEVAVELARSIVLQPHGFYVNAHSTEYPGGAVRGQLRGPFRR